MQKILQPCVQGCDPEFVSPQVQWVGMPFTMSRADGIHEFLSVEFIIIYNRFNCQGGQPRRCPIFHHSFYELWLRGRPFKKEVQEVHCTQVW